MTITENRLEVKNDKLTGEGQAKRTLDFRSLGILVVLFALWLSFNFASDGLFLSGRNLSNLLVQCSVVAILAVGLTKLMIAGHIDLSIGSSVALTGLVAATVNVYMGAPPIVAILAAIAVGAVMGLLQGGIVAFFGVPSFIATLGGMLAFRGVGYVISNGQTIAPLDESFTAISNSYLSPALAATILIAVLGGFIGLGIWQRNEDETSVSVVIKLIPVIGILLILGWVTVAYNGLPVPAAIAGVIAGLGAFVLGFTRLGRQLFVLGGNADAAKYAGISKVKVTLAVFVIMGVLYGAAGSLDVARLGGAPPGLNTGLELTVIAACVIGGTSLFGGRGSMLGSLIGVLLFQSLKNGMDLIGIDSNVQYIVQGLILVLAVVIDQRFRGRTR